MTAPQSDISIRKEGSAGRITLTRAKSLNALSASMAISVEQALDAWRNDSEIDIIIIDAEGEKAFCAGGDIAAIYKQGVQGNYEFGREYWYQEYRMNLKLSQYPKPIASFLQGYILGGGVGLGCHNSHRIVCESSKVAMPECGIGFLPDVGGTYLLAKAPSAMGNYLALTGDRMSAADAIHAGFADSFVPSEQWQNLKAKLIKGEGVDAIAAASEEPPAGVATANFLEVAEAFNNDSALKILDTLKDDSSQSAQRAVKAMSKNSPLSLCASVSAIAAAQSQTLEQALAHEYRFAYRAQEHSDILEGIRAQIIEKDFSPNWRHGTIEAAQSAVEPMFNTLGEKEWTPTK